MRHMLVGLVGVLVLGGVSSAMAMEVAPDPSPLLFDRVRTFDAVVVASLPDGFEKQTKPVKSTNAVTFPIKIERVFKGTLKPGDFLIDAHEKLPGELAKRDPAVNGKRPEYLLVMMLKDKNRSGYMGAAQLWLDLARFIPNDPSLEKTVAAFAAAKDQQPATLLTMCGELLGDAKADAKLSATAAGHVIALAARSTREWVAIGPDSRETRRKAVEAVAPAIVERGKLGQSIPAVAGFADAAIDCGVDQAKVLDPAMAPAMRKWLADALAAIQAKASGYPSNEDIAAVADALGHLKDKESAQTIAGLIKEPWMRRISQSLRASLVLIVGEDEANKLAPAGRGLQGPIVED